MWIVMPSVGLFVIESILVLKIEFKVVSIYITLAMFSVAADAADGAAEASRWNP